MYWLVRWWRQTNQYELLNAHLRARGLGSLARAMTSLIAAVLAIMAASTLWIPGGPRGLAAQACALAACGGALSGAVLWAVRFPTRRQAHRFALVSSASIALVAVAQSDPVIAMFTCTASAMMASYIAIFHTPWLMTLNFAIAIMVGAGEAIRVAEQLNVVAAACAFLLLVLPNLVVPIGIQVVVHVLGTDAVLAERDPLTGLFTRRAFHRRAIACLEQGCQQRGFVVVTVIDLDRFKQLNDSYGHSTGDDALVSVSRALRDTTDDGAVIGRSGGEEFVIATICQPDDVSGKAQQLCDEIAALACGITASIGTAGIYPAYRTGNRSDLLIELIAAADAAMYAAKRRGGNQAGHHEWPLPPPLVRYVDGGTGYCDDGHTDYCDGVSA